MKLLIKIRKKVLLPIKWFFTKKEKIRTVRLKSVKDILAKREEIVNDLLRAQRVVDEEEQKIQEGRLMLINYILNE